MRRYLFAKLCLSGVLTRPLADKLHKCASPGSHGSFLVSEVVLRRCLRVGSVFGCRIAGASSGFLCVWRCLRWFRIRCIGLGLASFPVPIRSWWAQSSGYIDIILLEPICEISVLLGGEATPQDYRRSH